MCELTEQNADDEIHVDIHSSGGVACAGLTLSGDRDTIVLWMVADDFYTLMPPPHDRYIVYTRLTAEREKLCLINV